MAPTGSADAAVYMQRLEHHQHPQFSGTTDTTPMARGNPPNSASTGHVVGRNNWLGAVPRAAGTPTVIAIIQFGITSPLLRPRAARHLEATNVTSGTCCHCSASLQLRTLPASPRWKEHIHSPDRRAGTHALQLCPVAPLRLVGAVETGIKFSKENRSTCLEASQPSPGTCSLTH